MKELQNKINGYLNAAIGYSIIMVLLGLVIAIFPGLTLDVIRWVLAIVLLSVGIALIVNDFRRQTVLTMFSGSLLGVLSIVLGFIVITHPDIMGIMPVVLGAYMIVSSVFSLRLASSLKGGASSFWIALLTAIVEIICGVVLILNPMIGAAAMMSVMGIVLIAYGLSTFVEVLVLRSNLKEVASYIKAQLKYIDSKEEKSEK